MPESAETDIKSLFGDQKKSSFPSCRHMGCRPPALEICHLPLPPPKGITYTSNLPDSFEE